MNHIRGIGYALGQARPHKRCPLVGPHVLAHVRSGLVGIAMHVLSKVAA